MFLFFVDGAKIARVLGINRAKYDEFIKQRKRRVVEMYQKDVEKFLSLQTIDNETKVYCRNFIRQYCKEYARNLNKVSTKVGGTIFRIAILWAFAYFAFYITIPVLIFDFRPNKSIDSIFPVGIIYGLMFWVILFSLFKFILKGWVLSIGFKRWSLIIDIILLVDLWIVIEQIHEYNLFNAIAIGIVVSSSCFAMLHFFTFIFLSVYFQLLQGHELFSPELVIYRNLVDLLTELENQSKKWNDFKFKKNLMQNLENIALQIEYHIPRKVGFTDENTTLWIQNVTTEIAAAFRDLKKWIFLPQLDTQEHLRQQIANSLICFINGNWSGLRRIERSQVDSKKVRFMHILDYSRKVLAAILPLLLIFLVQQIPEFRIGKSYRDYLVVGGVIWAIVQLTIELDPLLGAKFQVVREAAESIPGFPKL